MTKSFKIYFFTKSTKACQNTLRIIFLRSPSKNNCCLKSLNNYGFFCQLFWAALYILHFQLFHWSMLNKFKKSSVPYFFKYNQTFFDKQYFYKQHQAEIGKKSNFCYFKIIFFLHRLNKVIWSMTMEMRLYIKNR